jgi:hypothetical protein
MRRSEDEKSAEERRQVGKVVQWDEENLAENAEEAARSPRTPIDEPDTPWASPPRELEDDVAPSSNPDPSSALAEAALKLGAIQQQQEHHDQEHQESQEHPYASHPSQPAANELQQRLKDARARANAHRSSNRPPGQPQ